MSALRFTVLALCVLAATCVSASSLSSEWAAPAANEWPSAVPSAHGQLKSLASELAARHAEFLMQVGESSTGGSGSTGSITINTVKSIIKSLPEGVTIAAFKEIIQQSFNALARLQSQQNHDNLSQAVPLTVTILEHVLTQADLELILADEALNTPARRLLQTMTRGGLKVGDIVYTITIQLTPLSVATWANLDSSNLASSIEAQLKCSSKASAALRSDCYNAAAVLYSTPSLEDPDLISLSTSMGGGNMVTLVVEQTVPGLTTNAAVTVEPPKSASQLVPGTMNGRETNGGYYFLGAVDVVFMVAAAVFALVHKSPAATLKYDTEMAPAHAAHSVDIVPESGVAVVGDEQAQLAGQGGQMDYRSVFALKHNVLEKKDNADDDDDAAHNDVHFILHQ